MSFFISNFWFVLFCAVLSLGASWILYFYQNQKNKFVFNAAWQRYILFVLRFLAIFLIALLLLNPFFKISRQEEIAPKLAVLLDVSKSIGLAKGMDTNTIKNWTKKIKDELDGDYQISIIPFAEKIGATPNEIQFDGKATDIYNALTHVDATFAQDHLTSLCLITDGNYNLGNNPIYYNLTTQPKLDVLLVGDSTPFFDFSVDFIDFNPLSYLNEKTTVAVHIRADKAHGVKNQLSLFKINGTQSQLIQQTGFTSNQENFQQILSMSIKPNTSGLHHYRAVIGCAQGEVNCKNNVMDFYIEVVDGKKNILILADAPHPDISALKSTLNRYDNYAVEAETIDAFSGDVSKYDLVIFHNLPSKNKDIQGIVKSLKQQQVSVWYWVGTQTNVPLINQSQQLAKLNIQGNYIQEARPIFNSNFSYFRVEQETINHLNIFPPTTFPFLEIEPIKDMQVLLYQKIGAISTQKPLWTLGYDDQQMVAITLGENIWKWRIQENAKFGNSNSFDEWIQKITNILAIKKDKKQFKIYASKSIYDEFETIILDATIYNKSYQLINTPDVKLQINGNNGFKTELEMIKNGDKYTVNLGSIPSGDYQISGYTVLDGKKLEETIKLSVKPQNLEDQYQNANYLDMKNLALNHQGSVYFSNQIDQWISKMKENIPPTKIKEIQDTLAMNDLIWILILILSLLSAEWILRKYWGSY